MQEINSWLQNGQDYNQGVKLYTKYGKNSFFKKLLLSEPTPYTIEKLEAELKAMAPAPPARFNKPQSNIDELPQPPKAIPEAGFVQPETKSDDHERYLLLKELQKTLYRQLERNMIELDLSNSQQVLHLTAKNIQALHAKITDIHKVIDFFDEKGKFPGEKVKISRPAAEEIQLLRQSVSRANTRLKSPTCRDIEQTKALIVQNKKRILDLGGKVKL